ncbi:hypothetical protein [Paenibacillus vortex]|uniref:hypothetical protein n=1 Tax=Paenibacillus vortex TaxID=71995 RepID=UPI0002E1E741|nr:hypothetical protein [Paenibacillus vortex]
MEWRKIGLVLFLAIALVLIGVWAKGYYSKKVFYVEGVKYSKVVESGSGVDRIQGVHSAVGRPLYVHSYDEEKRVEMGGEQYEIRPNDPKTGHSTSYDVLYPDGKKYRVELFGERNGNLFHTMNRGKW